MTHTYSPAQLAQGKAALANTIPECDYALADIRQTIDAFTPDTGAHLRYLSKLYEERDAYIARRAELSRSPSAEMKLEMMRNTLRMINFRAVEGLRDGAPTVLLHDIMRLSREAIYNSEK
ncbi:hypothetical protein UFOVP55_56 [uncultured Caudovirales phage]|uniref:Uncharacterized protein n=1 Tax=uncultured Caudovirales phage TaxID=2100421 RepID=A0A6J5KW18_9CAUD|nr:hypothetical protein UFOVP55_56 [uncultured Caudovirales phage]